MGVSTSHVARALLIALTLLLVGLARPASATSPYLVVPSDEVRQASPAFRYANMSDAEAYAELRLRGVPFIEAGPTKGVRAPVRLTGPLHGVHVHSSLPVEKRATTMFEILDARLALSVDDFCALLERHDIVELVHYTMYRPNGPKPGLEHVAGKRKGKRSKKASSKKQRRAKKTSKRSSKRKSLGKGSKQSKRRQATSKKPSKKKSGSTKKSTSKKKPAAKKKAATKPKRKGRRKGKAVSRKKSSSKKRASSSRKRSTRRSKKKPVKKSSYAPPGTRHPAGLAIDVGGLRKRDGRWLSVAHHFQGRIGARTCGSNTNPPKSPQARELWSIVCEAADLGLFTYVLTPNYDAPHADHFHMEIRGDVKWFLYH